MRVATLAILATLATSPALAVGYRYDSAANRVYVEGGADAPGTLSGIKAALPDAPLTLVSDNPKIWYLAADLWIVDGSALWLHSVAKGGDVDELRLKSDNDGSGFVQVTADIGTIDIEGAKVTSWDFAAAGPDTDHRNGRAFIRVRSHYGPDGVTPMNSGFHLNDAEIQYLGYKADEAYGLVAKVVSKGDESAFDHVDVFGSISNSHLHHNFKGVYGVGLTAVWSGNQVDHNLSTGMEAHGHCDGLSLDGNDASGNGSHGIVLSGPCPQASIRNGFANGNGGHGILLERGADDAVVEDNSVGGNARDGIAVVASSRATLQRNWLSFNGGACVRLSAGASDNLVADSSASHSPHGYVVERGSGPSGDAGRPKRNQFQFPQGYDTTAEGIVISDADDTSFVHGFFSETHGQPFRISRSAGTEIATSIFSDEVLVVLSGTSGDPTSLTVRPAEPLSIQLQDANSTAQFRDDARAIFDVAQPVFTVARPATSVMTLTQAKIGGAATMVSPRELWVTPPAGVQVRVDPTSWAPTSRAWRARSTSISATIGYVVGGFPASGASYVVKQGSTKIGTFVVDGNGRIAFSAVPGTTATVGYTVQPAP